MSTRSTRTESPVRTETRSGAAALCLVGGVVAGIAFMGWASKPAPVAVAAPVAVSAIDYAKITEAVRAGFPAPAPVAVAAPAKPAEAAPAPVKRKVRKAAPAPARVVYVVPAYHGCTCRM